MEKVAAKAENALHFFCGQRQKKTTLFIIESVLNLVQSIL